MPQTALIIISLMLFIIILIGLSAGGWFGYKWYSSRNTTTDTGTTTTDTGTTTTDTGINGGTTGTNSGTTGTNSGTTGTNGGTGTTTVDSTEGPVLGYNPTGTDATTYDWDSNLKPGIGVLDTLVKMNGRYYKWDGTPRYKFKFAYPLNTGKMEVTIDGIKSDKTFNIYGNDEGYNVYDVNGNNYSIYNDINENKLKVIEDRGTYEMIPA